MLIMIHNENKGGRRGRKGEKERRREIKPNI